MPDFFILYALVPLDLDFKRLRCHISYSYQILYGLVPDFVRVYPEFLRARSRFCMRSSRILYALVPDFIPARPVIRDRYDALPNYRFARDFLRCRVTFQRGRRVFARSSEFEFFLYAFVLDLVRVRPRFYTRSSQILYAFVPDFIRVHPKMCTRSSRLSQILYDLVPHFIRARPTFSTRSSRF